MTPPMTPREKVELKPCPFCGGDAVAGSNFDNDHYVMCGADCDKCGGMVGYMKTEMAAIENWNRRTALASGSGDHAELGRLAAAATPGPWKVEIHGTGELRSGGIDGADGKCVFFAYDDGLPPSDENAAFIAAANPSTVLALLAENAALRAACAKSNDEICQSLGKALGYPWFKDDQVNFPRATEENGVCVGDHVAESVADEAASRISALLAENAALRDREKAALKECSDWARQAGEATGKLEASEMAGVVEDWRDRATEAERKLAEARDALIQADLTIRSFPGADQSHVEFIRTFLSSKEAERG